MEIVRELNGALYSRGGAKENGKQAVIFFFYCLVERKRGELLQITLMPFFFNVKVIFEVICNMYYSSLIVCCMGFSQNFGPLLCDTYPIVGFTLYCTISSFPSDTYKQKRCLVSSYSYLLLYTLLS